MPEIQIRPANSADIPALMAIDHSYTSERVWQMEIHAGEERIGVSFREVQLPRSVRVAYPRPVDRLADEWTFRSGLLVALLEEQPVGYTGLMLGMAPVTTWMTDLAVARRMRRRGIGSALVLAAQEWAAQRETRRLVMEMQPKNTPTIHLAQKLGFDFCGYNDRYYANHDISLFFAKGVR